MAGTGRLVVVTVAGHLALALVVLGAFELVVPNLTFGSASAPSGFDYGHVFGTAVRPIGWWVAGAIVALIPVDIAVRLVERATAGRRRRR